LIALASATRVSEIAALSAEEGFIQMNHNKSEVTLRPFDGFLAKNQRREEAPRSYTLKALGPHAPSDDPERFLCPVRALQTYLRRTNPYRGNRKRLFLSLIRSAVKEISSHSVSRWLREAIRESYRIQGQVDQDPLFQVSAHEVRALATSEVVWKNTSVVDVLKAAYWSSHNIFTDYYLRQKCQYSKSLENKRGAVVCAGIIITLGL